MSKFKKKPVVIEAVQFDGTDKSVEWLLPQLTSGQIGRSSCHLHIKTLEGVMTADIGDWIIQGVNGEFYPCKPDIFEKTYEDEQKCTDGLTFGLAIEALKFGRKARRKGWNGKGIYIKLQVPDVHSKMTSPYIYIDTTGLQSDNPDAPRSCVPWVASQTDMLANDWEVCE